MNFESFEKVVGSLEEPTLVDTRAAAGILGVKPATLVIWRCARRYDLAFVKIGRLVMYDIRDLAEFVARHKVRRAEPEVAGEKSPRLRSKRARPAKQNAPQWSS